MVCHRAISRQKKKGANKHWYYLKKGKGEKGKFIYKMKIIDGRCYDKYALGGNCHALVKRRSFQTIQICGEAVYCILIMLLIWST